jgi:HSP20 family protein
MTYAQCNPRQKQHHDLMRFFGDMVHRPIVDIVEPRQRHYPSILSNITADDQAYFIHMAVPGFAKDEINIALENGKLIVKGKKVEQSTSGRSILREWNTADWTKAFTLPKDAIVSTIDASYDAGVLTLTIAKSEKPQPQSIEVK